MLPTTPKLSTIPTEMISRVTSYVIADARLAVVRNEGMPPYGWTALTHICQSWRKTIIGHAAFWKDIILTNVDALATSLTRSRHMPLAISGSLNAEAMLPGVQTEIRESLAELWEVKKEIKKYERGIRDMDDLTRPKCLKKLKKTRQSIEQRIWNVQMKFEAEKQEDMQKLELIQRNLWHLRSLKLKASSRVLKEITGPQCTPAPILEELDIERTDGRQPADLSAFTSPVMRRLRLYDFEADDFRALIGSSLTYLHIACMGVTTTAGDMIQILSCTPGLETLKLFVWLQSTPGNTALVRSVELPALRHLEFSIAETGEAELLSFVSMPNLEIARLYVTCTKDLEHVGMLIGRRIGELRGETTELRGCTVYTPNEQTIYVTLTPDAGPTDARSMAKGIHIEFNEFDDGDERLVLNIMAQHFISVLQDVEYLSIRDGCASSEGSTLAWRELYEVMTEVKRLHLSGTATSTFPTGLVIRKQTADYTYWAALFPHLDFVELESVWFQNSSPSRLAAQDEGDFFDRLIRPYQRQGHGCHIKDLTSHIRVNIIKGVNIFDEHVYALREAFDHVAWDGFKLEKQKNDAHQEGVDYKEEDEVEDDSGDEDLHC